MAKYRDGVRIIGGRWKGTKIPVFDVAGLRPTTDRIRESLFNWLQFDVEGASCLDLFAGSGALSLEALSRGAGKAVAVDNRREVIDNLERIRNRLGIDNLHLLHNDAQSLLSTPAQSRFNIVFIDPPFDQQLQNTVCALLQENSWLSPAALVYIEAATASELVPPCSWSLLKSKRAGNVQYKLLRAGD